MASINTNEQSITLKDGFPATAMIKELLGKLQVDMGSYKRNSGTCKAILSQSNIVYDAINALITQIENSGANLNWDDFERWTGGVTSLEDLLLKFWFSKKDLPIIPQVESMDKCLIFVDTWVVDQETIITFKSGLDATLEKTKLVNDRPGVVAPISTSRRAENVAALNALVDNLKDHDLADDQILGDVGEIKYVSDVKAALGELSGLVTALPSTYPELCEAKAVAGAMLLHIPFMVFKVADLGVKVDEHVRSLNVWKEAKKFVAEIKSFLVLSPPSEQDEKDFQEKFDAFRKILSGIAELGPLSPQVLSLMRLVAQVRRPFYGRSVSMVKCWYQVNGYKGDNSLEKENTKEGRKKVRETLRSTIKIFTRAKDEIISFEDAMNTFIEPLNTEYEGLFKEMEVLAEKYADEKINTGWKEDYALASKIDKLHLDLFRKKHNFQRPEETPAPEPGPGA